MELRIPNGLAFTCRKTPERSAWLTRLPYVVRKLEERWSLRLDGILDGEEASCSYVSAVLQENGTPAVLKVAMPHMEGEHEIPGLLFWRGDPTVRLLAADEELGAMLF
jgi:streptomycin 6-kinase